jgi:hypothetical protein
MKLVSMLCLILGTACITGDDAQTDRRTGTTIEPTAPDLEAIDELDELELQPNAPDLVGASRDEESRAPTACLVENDCAADEACLHWTCTRIRVIPDERPFQGRGPASSF